MGLEVSSGTLIFVVSNYSVSVSLCLCPGLIPFSGCRPSALKYYMPRLAVTQYCGCAIVVSPT